MDFSLPAGALAHVVGLVKGCIPGKSTMPILNHVRIEATAGHIAIRATNLEMEAEAKSQADVAADGVVTVPGEILFGIVKRLPKTALATLKIEGNRLAVTCGRSRYQLATLPHEDFPHVMPVPVDAVRFTMPGAKLAEMLTTTRYAVGTDQSRFFLNGVYLHVADGKLTAVATDGHRFGRLTCDMPRGADLLPGMIVPTAAVREIVTVLGEVDGDATVIATPGRVHVEVRDFMIGAALIDSTYVDYAQLVPAPTQPAMTLRPAALSDALDRAMVVYQTTDVKAPKVLITTGAKGVDLSAGAGFTGDGVEDVEATVHERGATISLNARYLAEMLKLWPGDVEMDVEPTGPGCPILFTSRALPDVSHIIMPQTGGPNG